MANNFNAHGYLAITNNYGCMIEITRDGEKARLAFTGANGMKVCRWQQIKNNTKGEFVTRHGSRYYLAEFMRVEK